jgi:nucleotide-binding universal stress UspA family protein
MEIRHILVPYEGSPSSEVALKKALLTAQIFSAEVTVVFVATDATALALSEKVRELTVEKNKSSTTRINFVMRKGKVFKEIVKLEKEIGADLIMMGTHGVSGFQEFWIGSNAFRVVSSSNCPVITMQEIPYPESFQKILLPLVDSDETRQKIPLVSKIAAGFDAEVVIYCVSKETEPEVKTKLHLYAKQAEEYLDKYNVKHSFAEHYGNNVASQCIDFSKENGIDLISIMTETESSGSFFMGTYAQQLVNHSPIPVLSIHARSLSVGGRVGV